MSFNRTSLYRPIIQTWSKNVGWMVAHRSAKPRLCGHARRKGASTTMGLILDEGGKPPLQVIRHARSARGGELSRRC